MIITLWYIFQYIFWDDCNMVLHFSIPGFVIISYEIFYLMI